GRRRHQFLRHRSHQGRCRPRLAQGPAGPADPRPAPEGGTREAALLEGHQRRRHRHRLRRQQQLVCGLVRLEPQVLRSQGRPPHQRRPQRVAGRGARAPGRCPKEYSGELLAPENLPQEGAQRGGHIPGAANIPWAQAVREDGTFKSASELKELYQAKGVTPDKAVIAYCRIGERSSHTWFVLHYLLGYPNVRNYDGSWTEWGSLIGAPIEK